MVLYVKNSFQQTAEFGSDVTVTTFPFRYAFPINGSTSTLVSLLLTAIFPRQKFNSTQHTPCTRAHTSISLPLLYISA